MRKLYLLFMFSGKPGDLNCFVVRLPDTNPQEASFEILQRDRIKVNGKKHVIHTWMVGVSNSESDCWWDIPVYTTEKYYPEPIAMWEFREWMNQNNIQELHENFYKTDVC